MGNLLRKLNCCLLIMTWLCGGCTFSDAARQPPHLASQTALTGSALLPAALALPRTGAAYIAYFSGPPDYAIYLTQPEQPPEFVGVAGNQQRTEVTLSLALTPADQPGIAYVDDRTGDLIYAERPATRWITQTVDTAGQVGHFASLDYDQHGQPHISYFDNSYNDIKYATRGTHGWQIETIDASGQPGFHIPAGFTQLALGCEPDATRCTFTRPRVAYLAYRYKPYDGELRYATRTDQGWQIETVDAARGTGGFPALVLDAQGQPWISYYRLSTWDFNQGELRVAHRQGRRWQIDRVDVHDNAGRYNALALTPDGRPVVAYYAAVPGDLRLAWWDTTWHTRTLLDEGNVGGWITLALDAQNIAHLTYADVGSHQTHYASLDMSKP